MRNRLQRRFPGRLFLSRKTSSESQLVQAFLPCSSLILFAGHMVETSGGAAAILLYNHEDESHMLRELERAWVLTTSLSSCTSQGPPSSAPLVQSPNHRILQPHETREFSKCPPHADTSKPLPRLVPHLAMPFLFVLLQPNSPLSLRAQPSSP